MSDRNLRQSTSNVNTPTGIVGPLPEYAEQFCTIHKKRIIHFASRTGPQCWDCQHDLGAPGAS